MTPLIATAADGLAHASMKPDILFDNTDGSQGGPISWGAVFAGAAAAAALPLVLLMLGIGLGLSSVSLWVSEGASARTMGTSTIV